MEYIDFVEKLIEASLKVNWKYQDALEKERKKNAAEELRNINVREQQIALRERKAVSRLPIAAATKLNSSSILLSDSLS